MVKEGSLVCRGETLTCLTLLNLVSSLAVVPLLFTQKDSWCIARECAYKTGNDTGDCALGSWSRNRVTISLSKKRHASPSPCLLLVSAAGRSVVGAQRIASNMGMQGVNC
eukprot:2254798-Amphidinium_carterae.1